MKFSCEKSTLLNAVNSSIKAVTNKSTIPALECLHILAGENITISGYDLNIGIKSKFDANIFEKGSCLINAKLLSDILRKLTGDEITISVSSNLEVKIICEKSIFDLTAIEASEFPEIPSVQRLNTFSIKSSVLKDMIAQTKFAKGYSESNIIQTGFLFEINQKELTIVAVDGYKLALRRETIESSTEESTSFVVPGMALIELEKLLGNDILTFYSDSKQILFEVDDITLTTNLLDGDFLNYKMAIPSDFSATISCNVATLRQSIEVVSLIVSEKFKSPVRFNFENNILKLSCVTAISKSYDEYIFDGEISDLEIGFDYKYILETLNACPAESANLSFKGSLSPVVITPDDSSNSFLYLVLPLRLKNNG